MSTRTRLNLVLGVVLATLLTALWLWPAAPAPETQTRVPLPVDTSVETVARIEIQRPAAAPVASGLPKVTASGAACMSTAS